MNSLKSHFVFNRSQRSGIFLLIVLIVGLLGVNYFFDFSKPVLMDTTSLEVIALQKEIDSLRAAAIEARKPKQYAFNPNYLTSFKAYTLGLSPQEFDRLKAFRTKNLWVNSIADFKHVTKVSDSLLAEISPLFKFPDWVSKPRPNAKVSKTGSQYNGYTELTFDKKMDLNSATLEQLQKVSGLGKVLSTRIIKYREKLNGFAADNQLYGVWGLQMDVVQRTLNVFAVKTPKKINTININRASASDISTIPGISFELAKEIWEFVAHRNGIGSVLELEKIEGLSKVNLKLIQLYLSVD